VGALQQVPSHVQPAFFLRTAVRKYRTDGPRYARQVAETAGVDVVRLRSPREVQRWKQRTAKGPAESRSRAARHTTGP
jgi:hypothetical protein